MRDSTTSTKLILWEDYVNSLEVNKTYLLKNLRVKITKNERYLNTAKTEKFTFMEATPFADPLVEIDEDLSVITTTTWNVRILGIQQISKQHSCSSCGKTVNESPNGILGECTSTLCKMNQLFSSGLD